jgi:hypothetical protein
MTERPILFSAEMVRAILDGRKTQTRRIIKPQPPAEAESVCRQLYSQEAPEFDGAWTWWAGKPQKPITRPLFCRYGQPGDQLWVSETDPIITLRITDIRVERLQDISEDDARAEGAMWHDGGTLWHSGWRHDYSDVHADAYSSFARLWNNINGPGAWGANPWVWAISFERVKP